MKLTPVFTEKSMSDAKEGRYTFYVSPQSTKGQIKRIIADVFKVEVASVKTMNFRKLSKKNVRGRTVTVPAIKKTVVSLKGGKTLDIFETKGKK